MLSPPAEAVHENEECLKDLAYRAVNRCENISEKPCISQDSDSIYLASSDTPDLTDSSGLAAISSISDTIPIDPRILDLSTATSYYSEGELEQHDERSLSKQLASNPLAKRPGIYFPSQLSSVGPGLGGIGTQGVVVPEIDSTLIHPASPLPSPPSEEPKRGLTRKEFSAVAEPSPTIQSSPGVLSGQCVCS
jgi:hypothetical protein